MRPTQMTAIFESDEAPDDPGADQLILGHADDDRPIDRDWEGEARETDSPSDLSIPGEAGEAFDFDRLEYAAGSLVEHLQDQLHGVTGTVGRLALLLTEMIEETGYLPVSTADIARDTGEEIELVEKALALVQDLDPPGVGARNLAECLALQARAADRYDPAMARLIDNLDLLVEGPDQGFDAHLRGRRGGSRRHDPRASRLRPQARLPLRRATRSMPRRPTSSSAAQGRAIPVELNGETLPRLLVNRTYYAELKSGPQDKASKAWLSRMPGQRRLAGEGARPACPDHRQGGQRDRRAAAGLLRHRRLGD